MAEELKTKLYLQGTAGSPNAALYAGAIGMQPRGARELSLQEAQSLANQYPNLPISGLAPASTPEQLKTGQRPALAGFNREMLLAGNVPGSEILAQGSQPGTSFVPVAQEREYQQQQQGLSSGQLQLAPGSTPQAPLYVPKGTPTPEQANKDFQATQPTPTFQQTGGSQSFQQLQQSILQTAQQMAQKSQEMGVGLVPQFQQQFPDISKQFEEAHQKTKELGQTAPTDATGAKDLYDTFLPEGDVGSETPSLAENLVRQDPYLNSTIQAFQQYMDMNNQRASLTETYQKILKDSGIEQIDLDLINMKNVIEGTEDDIRNEVMKAGGFATESQVMALANARNKQLIKNYNTLLETRNAKSQYLNTMLDLTVADRQEADALFETKMNFGMKIAEINQQMKQNAISTIERVAQTLGWDGVYQATQGNPQIVSQIERTYGLPQGSLTIAAQRDAESRALEQAEQGFKLELDLAKFEEDKRQFDLQYALDQQKLAVSMAGGGELTSKQISQAIQLSNSLKSHPAYTDMLDIQTGLQGVLTGLAAENGFGDITAINAFQRMVDPGATVRSEDVVLLQTGSGLIDKVLSDYPIEKLRKGDKLPQAVRDRMKEVALELYDRRAGNYNQSVGNQYRQLSTSAGLPFELIGQEFLDVENLGFDTSGQVGSTIQSQEDANKIIESIPTQPEQKTGGIGQVVSQANKGVGGIDVFGLLGSAWNWLTGK